VNQAGERILGSRMVTIRPFLLTVHKYGFMPVSLWNCSMVVSGFSSCFSIASISGGTKKLTVLPSVRMTFWFTISCISTGSPWKINLWPFVGTFSGEYACASLFKTFSSVCTPATSLRAYASFFCTPVNLSRETCSILPPLLIDIME